MDKFNVTLNDILARIIKNQENHTLAYRKFYRIEFWTNIGIIILSFMIIFLTFISFSNDKIIMGIISAIVLIATIFQMGFKYSSKINKHYDAAFEYGKIRQKVEILLVEDISDELVKIEIDKINKQINQVGKEYKIFSNFNTGKQKKITKKERKNTVESKDSNSNKVSASGGGGSFFSSIHVVNQKRE